MKTHILTVLLLLMGFGVSAQIPVVKFASYKDGALFLRFAEVPKDGLQVRLCIPKRIADEPRTGGGFFLADATRSKEDERVLIVASKFLPKYVGLDAARQRRVYELTKRTGARMSAGAPNLLVKPASMPY